VDHARIVLFDSRRKSRAAFIVLAMAAAIMGVLRPVKAARLGARKR